LSKKTREERIKLKKARQQKLWKEPQPLKENFSLRHIEPLTDSQCKVFDAYEKGKNLVLYGTAGTGKTFLSVYLALKEIYETQKYDKVVIFRSAVPSRDAGFLPGNMKEKAAIYETPYHQICATIYGRGDAYTILKNKGVIEFMTSSYVRGITLDNAIIIVDEIQNFIDSELNSVITRVGKGSKLILCGDFSQNDLKKEKTAFNSYIKIFKAMPSFNLVEFGISDVVRSGLVKEYILTRHKLEVQNSIPFLGD